VAAPPSALPSAAELERAARILAVRSRREVSSAFAGGYRSAFRGGGVEFEESRPYTPGDDVRQLDWNALARTGTPYVKRFREERDQSVVLALDVSRSMAFGSGGRSKAAHAAHAAALVAGAAARAGDRIGLVTFAEGVREELAPERGAPALFHRLERLAAAAAAPDGVGALATALARVERALRRHAVIVVLSDFRDDAFLPDSPRPEPGPPPRPGPGRPSSTRPEPERRSSTRAEPGRRSGRLPGGLANLTLARLARRHDVVAAIVVDPREEELPAAGTLLVGDAERPGPRFRLPTGARARERYRAAAALRRTTLERTLRASGADLLWLRTDRDPLRALARFFARRPAHARRLPR